MERLSFDRHARILNGELLGVTAAKAFITVRRRNAWHSTTSRQYMAASSLELGLAGAKADAEEWRKQGSAFEIIETPAVVLLSADGLVVCTDFHRDTPFAHWASAASRSSFEPGNRLAASLRSLGVDGAWSIAPDRDSLVQGVERFWPIADSGVLDESERFSRHVSVSDGGDYWLRWLTYDLAEVSSAGVFEVLQVAQGASLNVSPESAIERYTEALMARTEALYAELHSEGP